MRAKVHRPPKADPTRLNRRIRLSHQLAAARGQLVKHPIAPGCTVRVALEHQQAAALLVIEPGALVRAANVNCQNVLHMVLRIRDALMVEMLNSEL